MSGEHALYLFGSHFTTEHLNHNWSQQVHTYSGTCFCETNLSSKLNCICFLVVATHDCCMLVMIHLPEPQPFVFFLMTVSSFDLMACAASSLILVF